MDIILASQSPRRKELMELMGLSFKIKTSNIDEYLEPGTEPQDAVCMLAYKKAMAVANENPDSCVVGSDTIVVYDGVILGKPKTKEEASEMLHLLSGKTHTVYTGIAVITSDRQLVDFDATQVEFDTLSDDEIEEYIKSGEPMDKAGAYGIQGLFSRYIKRIDGNFYSVMGLPVNKLYNMIKNI